MSRRLEKMKWEMGDYELTAELNKIIKLKKDKKIDLINSGVTH